MNQYVYLYELDTVNKSTEEMVAANEKMYQVLVNEGNCLILTYNQLGDSVLIGNWIQNEQMNTLLIDAIAKGRVAISPFKNIHSCVEYIQTMSLQSSIDNKDNTEKEYIFSALPFLRQNYGRETRYKIYDSMLDALSKADAARLDELEGNVSTEDIKALKNYIIFLLKVNIRIPKYLNMQETKNTLYNCVEKLIRVVQFSPEVHSFLEKVVIGRSVSRSEVINKLEKSFGQSEDLRENEFRKEAETAVNFCYNWQLQRNIIEGGVELKNDDVDKDSYNPAKDFEAFKAFYHDNHHIYLSTKKEQKGKDDGY